MAGFASAVILILVALFIGYESVQRILAPVAISFNEPIGVAVIGLGVNVVSAFLLREDHHDHDHHEGSANIITITGITIQTFGPLTCTSLRML